MWNIINKLKRILRISVTRTLFFNFYMLPFKQAIKLPILIMRNVRFYNLSGMLIIDKPVKFGMIRFGFFGEDNMYWNSKKTLLKIEGTFVLHSNIHFGNGIILRVEKGSILKIESNVKISNEVKIICSESIHIKENSRIAWECQIIDTDFHYIVEIQTNEINKISSPIIIGKNNWIGNRTCIVKRAITPDFCIIASGSLINKKMDIPMYTLVAGTPAKLIKEGVYRALSDEEKKIKNDDSFANI